MRVILELATTPPLTSVTVPTIVAWTACEKLGPALNKTPSRKTQRSDNFSKLPRGSRKPLDFRLQSFLRQREIEVAQRSRSARVKTRLHAPRMSRHDEREVVVLMRVRFRMLVDEQQQRVVQQIPVAFPSSLEL